MLEALEPIAVHVKSCVFCRRAIDDKASDTAAVTVVRAATGTGAVVGFQAHAACLAKAIPAPVSDHIAKIFSDAP